MREREKDITKQREKEIERRKNRERYEGKGEMAKRNRKWEKK